MKYDPLQTLPTTWQEFTNKLDFYLSNNKEKRTFNLQFKYKQYLKSKSSIEHLQGLKNLMQINQLLPNPFHYDLILNSINTPVVHYTLWVEKDLDKNQIDQIVKDKIGNLEYVYFENPPQNKTVKDLQHYHVFVHLEFELKITK